MIYSHRIYEESSGNRIPEVSSNTRIQFNNEFPSFKSNNKIVFIPNKNTKLAPISKDKQVILNTLKSNFSFHFPEIQRKKLSMLNLKMISTENPSSILTNQFTKKSTITPKTNERYSLVKLIKDKKVISNKLTKCFFECFQTNEFDDRIFELLFSVFSVFQKSKLEAFRKLKLKSLIRTNKKVVSNELKFNRIFDGTEKQKKQFDFVLLVKASALHLYSSRILQEVHHIRMIYVHRIILIQSRFRCYVQLQKLNDARLKVRLIQLAYRCYYANKRRKCAILIQAYVRQR